MNLFDLLAQTARRFPHANGVYLGKEPAATWAQLRERALRLAATLRARHPAGARVAVASENRPEILETMFGTWAAGQALVPINYKLHPREMADIVADAGASLVVASPDLAAGLRGALADAAGACANLRADGPPPLVVIGEASYTDCFAPPPAAPADTAPDDLAWLFYTSGTTGRSKGAMLSHRNILSVTVGHLADVEQFDERATQIHAAPMSHGSGLYIPAYVSRGAAQVIPASAGFDPDEVLDLCEAHRGCGIFLAPTMVQRLRLAAEASGRRPAGLRTIVYGGGPMYVEELKRSLAVFGQVFVQIYGQGESPMTITWLRREDHAVADESVLGSVGWARTGMEVAVVGEDGKPLPAGAIGEVTCRGDAVMLGYWKNPEATRAALQDGWLHTGDVGSFDERGYLTLRDRSKDVVISGGSNIYPREVEEALLTHPAVSEVCVVGRKDAEWGEVVVAFVVTARDVSAKELDAHCLSRIARFKRPKDYRFVDSLPKNSYGKVLKRELRDRL
ncbi:MAG: long-chain fatty acid--CoA ligase [Burkholderiaceae bacterium]|nr:long-chain fatty acid--CoA ligase [Burkholderiaceae bacterium]